MKTRTLAAALILTLSLGTGAAQAEDKVPADILNVSYDISRELFAQINPAFQAKWRKDTGQSIEVKQSHGGSSKQARSILEGLPADVVTFNQVTDVQVLADKGFVRADWQQAYPNSASPFYSLPAFLVRKGNPKNIKSWDDLVRSDVKVVFPNPKTSGNARYTYLAAYAFALEKFGGDQVQAKDFIRRLLANVPVFDTGGRGATTTFVERETGDVLISFEAEVKGIQKEYGTDKVEVVIPPVSLLAEFPVAVVDKVAEKRGSRKIASAYLGYLYSDEAQDILAKNYNRVSNPKIAEKYKAQFPNVRLYTVELFGGWDNIRKIHFAEGGILDQVFEKK
ncbi:thiosulfate ABC transporter substrate-binding protein CysP [Magnetospirillum fulvum]|uniref:ABC-type sulfate transport system, periplasmic component n=1 Tax=Magnetospirillum fulvum MGU-K5 TaxID=1316936 RepID=S9TJW9_MAGFU|nr:thiosulfate ABC transporter substrate-binding protein CysP [Magnetospirillum fulvum]EPY02576.1 ABC-type sulfate transport system, periplasmic component [Magnetospirillum fulvum MGU-K5]